MVHCHLLSFPTRRSSDLGAEIGAETDADRALLLHGALDIEEAAAEEEVRRRAMRDRRAGSVHHLHLVVDRKSTRLNSSHLGISYAVFCLKKKIDRLRDML